MSRLALFSGSTLNLVAEPSALRFETIGCSYARSDAVPDTPGSLAGPQERDLWSDLRILAEQGMVEWENGVGALQWTDWPLALELNATSLTAHSAPSHLLLKVDRFSDIGRADFQYIVRWCEGHREVAIERYGAFVQHSATGRIMHLDARTLAMVEAMEAFNALPEPERKGGNAAWGTFAAVRSNATETGALLDEYLESNTVVVPSTIGLTVREHDDGTISFVPRLAGMAESDAFAAKFMASTQVHPVSSLTTPDGQRVRVLLSDVQTEVLKRMQQVRRKGGELATTLRKQPEAAFDGIADAVDLRDVQWEYGPRVIGIGELVLPGDVRERRQSSLLSQLGTGTGGEAEAKGNATETPAEALNAEELAGNVEADLPVPPEPPKRSATAIDVLDEDSGNSVTLRFESDAQLAEFEQEVKRALSAGESECTYQDRRIRVEPELADALSRHSPVNATGVPDADDAGAVGGSGHLYLLINDHETSLTEALRVVDETSEQAPALHCEPPASLAEGITLQPHQREGLDWLHTGRSLPKRRGSVLADDMGLGKTLQLLSHVARMLEAGELSDTSEAAANGPWRPVLIIAPLLLVENGTWTDEIAERFADGGRLFEPWVVLRDEGLEKVRTRSDGRDPLGKPVLDPKRIMAHKVVITTYETLVAYQHSLAQLVNGRPIWSLVVFDEAQAIKSPKTKVSYAAKALAADFKVAATGTPVETRLRDLWNLLDTVEPSLLSTQRDFVERYERPAMNAADEAERNQALERLRAKLAYQQPGALLLRRDKSILENLPQRHEHRVHCEFTELERRTNASILGTLGTKGSRKNALVTLQQLHLASQHPVLAGAPGTLDDVEAAIQSSSRLRETVRILESVAAKGEKVLIFARSVDAQRMLAQVVSERFGIAVDVVNGQAGMVNGRRRTASGTARRDMLSRFRKSPGFSVIVLSPFVAGVGITLTEANHVIHYGRWWNPAIESQATDRAYRIGQTRDVHVYYPIGVDPTGEVPRTFDEALDELITTRRELARDFLVPAREDSDASSLYNSLASTTSVPQPGAPPVDFIPSQPRQIAALLIATAEREGKRAVWLGEAGIHGVHVLVRDGDAVECTRIVETLATEDIEIAEAAVVSWQRLLAPVAVRFQIAVRDEPPPTSGEALRWTQVAERAKVAGVSPGEMLLTPTITQVVKEVRRCLGLNT